MIVTKRELLEIRKGIGKKEALAVKKASDRELLFIELDDKGIEYKKNTSTVKLKELLKEDD